MATALDTVHMQEEDPAFTELEIEAERRIGLLRTATVEEIALALRRTSSAKAPHAYLEAFAKAPTHRLSIAEVQAIASKWPSTPISIQRSNTNKGNLRRGGLEIAVERDEREQHVAWALYSTRVNVRRTAEIREPDQDLHQKCQQVAETIEDEQQKELLELMAEQYLALPVSLLVELVDLKDESEAQLLIDKTNEKLTSEGVKLVIRNGMIVVVWKTKPSNIYYVNAYNNAQTRQNLFPQKKAPKIAPAPAPAPAPVETTPLKSFKEVIDENQKEFPRIPNLFAVAQLLSDVSASELGYNKDEIEELTGVKADIDKMRMLGDILSKLGISLVSQRDKKQNFCYKLSWKTQKKEGQGQPKKETKGSVAAPAASEPLAPTRVIINPQENFAGGFATVEALNRAIIKSLVEGTLANNGEFTVQNIAGLRAALTEALPRMGSSVQRRAEAYIGTLRRTESKGVQGLVPSKLHRTILEGVS